MHIARFKPGNLIYMVVISLIITVWRRSCCKKKDSTKNRKICYGVIVRVVFSFLWNVDVGNAGTYRVISRVEVRAVIYLSISFYIASCPRPSRCQSVSEEVRRADRLARGLSPSLHEARTGPSGGLSRCRNMLQDRKQTSWFLQSQSHRSH